MNTITDLRRELKAIGYKLKVESLSFGKSFTYIKISTGSKQPSIYQGKAQLAEWQDLIDFQKKNSEAILKLKKEK